MRVNGSAWAAAAMTCALLGTQAPAQDSATLNAIAACGTISKKSARLACYDAQTRGAQPRNRSQDSFAPAQAAPVSPEGVTGTTPSAAAPEPSFGAQSRRERTQRPREATEITAHVASATDNGVGHWTVTFDNGESWRMTENVPYFVPPRPGEEVRVRKAALGSFLMDVKNQPAVRVTRVQ